MHHLYRHTAVVITIGLLAFFLGLWWASSLTATHNGQNKAIILEIGINSAISSSSIWLILSLCLSRLPLPIWVIMGAISPYLIVPLLYHIPDLYGAQTAHDYGFSPQWKIGLNLVQSNWFTFSLVGTILGTCAYFSTILAQTIKLQNPKDSFD